MFYGHAFDEALEDRIQITIIATGFPSVRVGQGARKATNFKPRAAASERRSALRTPVVPAETLLDEPTSMPVKKKSLEEELQKPAFLRLKSNRFRA